MHRNSSLTLSLPKMLPVVSASVFSCDRMKHQWILIEKGWLANESGAKAKGRRIAALESSLVERGKVASVRGSAERRICDIAYASR